MKSIKLSDYFELRRPTYKYIQIIPHKSIRNYNSSNIAKAIANTYRSINRRIYKEKKKLVVETEFKISYIVDIESSNTNFYFLVPSFFISIILEKISEIWSKATIKVLEGGLKPFSSNPECYSLSYKKLDGLSLKIDKKLNEPLNSVLSVMDIMKDDDRVTICYNFIPRSQFGFLDKYEEMETKFKNRESLDKPTVNFDYMVKNLMLNILKIMDNLIEVINDFTGGSDKDKSKNIYESMLGLVDHQNNFNESKYKKTAQVIDTQILVTSSSVDTTRKSNNALSVCQALRVLDSDNELKYKPVKNTIQLEDFSFKNCKMSTMSTEEVGQLVQIPGRTLLTQLGINHIKTEESPVPESLKQGNKLLGTVTYKGEKVKAYLPTEWNLANCGLYLIGGQGAGKTNDLKIYARDCIKAGEGIILLDFIQNCGLSKEIADITPKNKLVEIDLASQDDIQAFCYNEMKISSKMTSFEKLDKASMQSEQMMNLIDSISLGDPLSSAMRRLFNSACIITSVLGFNSLKNTIDCLEDHVKRHEYIDMLNVELKEFLEEEIRTLEELDEYSKVSKKEADEGVLPVITGTKTAKLTFILDRIDLLRSNFKLKYMYKANSKNNIDLLECMREGKVVLIKMKDSDFNTPLQKNILVTYWITKIWLATQLRGSEMDKPKPRCNMIIDELFQAPTSLKIMEYILPQARKFALKPVLSTHYVNQLDSIFDALLTSNGSFRLLRGCTEDDFKYFKNKLDNYEYEDLRDMKQWHSLDIIYHEDGYSSFITHIPKFSR